MEDHKNKYNNFAKIMLIRFIPAMGLIALLVVAKHLVIQHYIFSMENILQELEISAISQLKLLDKTETLMYYFILILIFFYPYSYFFPHLKDCQKLFLM